MFFRRQIVGTNKRKHAGRALSNYRSKTFSMAGKHFGVIHFYVMGLGGWEKTSEDS